MGAKAEGTLLVVDDESEIREIIAMNVQPLGYQVLEAADGQQALEVVRARHVDVVMSDLMMPRVTGLALLTELREAGFLQPFIFLTAYPSQDSTLQALRLGAFDYLEKPFEGDELRALLKEAMRVSLEMARIPQRKNDKGDSTEEIQKLRTLRYQETPNLAASDGATGHKLANLFIAEATPQLLFCDAAIKGLSDAESRASELGYLFRVMQGVATAAESIDALPVVELARAAERFYTALRVRPRAVTEELIEVAQNANRALQLAVSTLGGTPTDATALSETAAELMRLAEELETGGVRRAS